MPSPIQPFLPVLFTIPQLSQISSDVSIQLRGLGLLPQLRYESLHLLLEWLASSMLPRRASAIHHSSAS
jgi:hypothetical protein